MCEFRQRLRNVAGEFVRRKPNFLQRVQRREEIVRNRAGELVPGEKKRFQNADFVELGNRTGETVVDETDSTKGAKLEKSIDVDLAGELKACEMKAGDNAAVADDADPSSGTGNRIRDPGIERSRIGERLLEFEKSFVLGKLRKGREKEMTTAGEENQEEESNSGHCRAGRGNGIKLRIETQAAVRRIAWLC